MTTAYEQALVALKLVDRTDPVTEIVAKKIIECAKGGEIDAVPQRRGQVLPRNWLLLYDDERALPIPDLVGTLCVIAHKNHQLAVRVLTADERGLRWVAPVKAIIPR